MRSRDRIVAVFESGNMAPHWRLGGLASIDVSILFTEPVGGAPEGAKTMRWRDHLYPVTIEQVLDAASLAKLSDAAADEADESGDLAGNRMYQDWPAAGFVDRQLS
jgi:hypothetical protein